jgi:mRNA-degrading endonuclease RelE of RelBE toxin-antitoxin system
MESYEIEFQPSVRKDFRKLSPDNASRILPRIEELAKDPFPPQSIKLKGSDRLYQKIRVGDYRRSLIWVSFFQVTFRSISYFFCAI